MENSGTRLALAPSSDTRVGAWYTCEGMFLIFQHMKDVAGRRQQLELEHEKALQALQKKQDEVRQLQKVRKQGRELAFFGASSHRPDSSII